MALVDSSVWIDLLRGRDTPAVGALRHLLASDEGRPEQRTNALNEVGAAGLRD